MEREEEVADELLREWAAELYPELYPVAIVKDFIKKAVARAYKAAQTDSNIIIWHNLQKNPADLPLESEFLKGEPDNHRYEWFIVATVGRPYRALYSFAKKKWFIDYEEMKIGTSYFEPIAWCDFPKFEE